jgi:hypothetical protein
VHGQQLFGVRGSSNGHYVDHVVTVSNQRDTSNNNQNNNNSSMGRQVNDNVNQSNNLNYNNSPAGPNNNGPAPLSYSLTAAPNKGMHNTATSEVHTLNSGLNNNSTSGGTASLNTSTPNTGTPNTSTQTRAKRCSAFSRTLSLCNSERHYVILSAISIVVGGSIAPILCWIIVELITVYFQCFLITMPAILKLGKAGEYMLATFMSGSECGSVCILDLRISGTLMGVTQAGQACTMKNFDYLCMPFGDFAVKFSDAPFRSTCYSDMMYAMDM